MRKVRVGGLVNDKDEIRVDKSTRWNVTFTKHIHQKRKVYHDGFLEIHSSTREASLFDELENLLECKYFIKEDSSPFCLGETLSFNSYLVDIGELVNQDDQHDRVANDPQPKLAETPKVSRRRKFRSPTVASIANDNAVNRCVNVLSPSKKVITEFKRREFQRYEDVRSKSIRNSVNFENKNEELGFARGGVVEGKNTLVETKIAAENASYQEIDIPLPQEWEVLYTHQLTKKAKTYQDGILKLEKRGLLGKQIKLYDLSQRLIDSRFLKNNEAVSSGASITFDGHLVDIGEARKVQMPATKTVSDKSCETFSHNIESRNEVGSKSIYPITDEAKESGQKREHVSENIKKEMKPFRDAKQILSILQRDVLVRNDPHLPEPSVAGTEQSPEGACDVEEEHCKATKVGCSVNPTEIEEPTFDLGF